MKANVLLGVATATGAWLLCAPAQAEGELRADWSVNKETQDHWDGGYDIRAERRSGIAGAINLGFGVSAASGYPNEIEKLDRDQYRSSTGTTLGSVNTIWLGGALRDWFVVGLGIYGMSGKKDELEMLAGGFMLHVEGFPLFSLGGRFRDISLYTNFGTGGLTIEGGPEKADGGLMSMVTLGSSFEILRLKYFALGPTLEGTYMYSQFAEGGGAFLGAKATIYGGP